MHVVGVHGAERAEERVSAVVIPPVAQVDAAQEGHQHARARRVGTAPRRRLVQNHLRQRTEWGELKCVSLCCVVLSWCTSTHALGRSAPLGDGG